MTAETETLPTLHGSRTTLRHVVTSDGPALARVFGDPLVARHMGIPLLRTDEDVRKLLDDIADGIRRQDLYQWAVTLADSDELVGTCTLAGIDRRNERAEIGFALAPDHWGRGLMSDTLPVLVDHAFDALGLHRLEADVDPGNVRSLRLLRRLGFRREGYLRERHLVDGERQDSVLLGLLADEWAGAS